MMSEIIRLHREHDGDAWDDTITLNICNMGQYSEDSYTMYLSIGEATVIRDRLTKLIETTGIF
jgi:hypothetical protein